MIDTRDNLISRHCPGPLYDHYGSEKKVQKKSKNAKREKWENVISVQSYIQLRD